MRTRKREAAFNSSAHRHLGMVAASLSCVGIYGQPPLSGGKATMNLPSEPHRLVCNARAGKLPTCSVECTHLPQGQCGVGSPLSLSVALRAIMVLGISWAIKEGLKHQGVDFHQKNAGSNNKTGVSTKSFTLPHLCTRELRASLK